MEAGGTRAGALGVAGEDVDLVAHEDELPHRLAQAHEVLRVEDVVDRGASRGWPKGIVEIKFRWAKKQRGGKREGWGTLPVTSAMKTLVSKNGWRAVAIAMMGAKGKKWIDEEAMDVVGWGININFQQ